MKIVYCHCSLYNPGGMERVLLNKVRWIRKNLGWETVIVTTDRHNRPPFYKFPDDVRIIDLDINYSDGNTLPTYKKILSYLRKRRLHRRRLTDLLMKERPDITVSLYPSESSFIPDIKDGSRKVLELHFNRFFRLQYGRKGILGLIDRYRSRRDSALARRFDRFVVLTEEDRKYWGNLPNINVIPNAALPMQQKSDCTAKRVMAAGRLDYQKSFDRLIEVWEIVRRSPASEGWRLDIFGQGEDKDMLCHMIADKGLTDTVSINSPTDSIFREYADSSVFTMSSRYEGFPMVMVEAMSAGLPVVTFDYKCGPRDIISDSKNGIIVPDGNLEEFARALLLLMSDEALRKKMGSNARSVTSRYSEEKVMGMWTTLFDSLTQ